MKYKRFSLFLYIIIFTANVNPQDKDTIETDPVNITAQAVLNRYIDAIGGKDKFTRMLDRTTVMTGTAMDQPIDILIKQKYPDKLYQELQVGEVKQILYYDGRKGMMVIGNEKINIEDKELERLKFDAQLHLLLDVENYGIRTELESNVIADSINCYKVTFKMPSGAEWIQFYSVDNALKVKEVKEIYTAHGMFEQESYFSDYREVHGLKFPFSIRQYFGIQEIDLKVSGIEINTGIDDSIFEVP